MKNRKGFTLVELLAVVVILGIITGISIPLIRNIQEQNTMRKYNTYKDSLKVSAKLYVDSYAEDLFGHEKSGCAVINYSQMEDKSLLKDISVDKESCKSDYTCVRVVKVDDHFGYYPMIGCGSMGADGKASSVSLKIPESANCQIETCGVDTKTIVMFVGDPENSNAISFQRKNVVVKIKSYTGFHEDIDIDYSFVNSVGAPQNNRDDPTIVGGWKKLNINYVGGNEQKRKIENGEQIVLSSSKVTTPSGLTGDYYIVLKINKLMNLSGRNWTTDNSRGVYAYLGPYKVDNTKPVFSNDSTVVSSATGYNSVTPKLKISVTDNYSTASDLRMCTAYDTATCSTTISDIKGKSNGWITYDNDKVLSSLGSYDGSSHTVKVYVADAAGNYDMKSYDYKVATRYTLTYDGNGCGSCDPTSKSVTFDSTAPAWGTLCSPSKNNVTFTGWNTKSDGTGSTVTSSTTASGNLKVYAQCRKNKVIFQFKVNSGETLASSTTSGTTTNSWTTGTNSLIYKNSSLYTYSINYDATSMDLANYNNAEYINISKSGYRGVSTKEWVCDSGCKTTGSTFNQASVSVTPSNVCNYTNGDCTVTLKVNWELVPYTITYTMGSCTLPSGSTNPTSYNVTSDSFTLVNPSSSGGYTFEGWSGTGLTGSSNTTVTVAKGSTGDRAYTAHCKDNSPPTLTLSVDNPSTYQKKHTATITIGDSDSGLAAGTYTIKYQWSTSDLSKTKCSDLTGSKSITVSAGDKSKSVTVDKTTDTGKGVFYICNSDEIKDVDGNSLAAGTKKSSNMRMDNTDPTLTCAITAQDSSGVDIKVSASDDHSGLKEDPSGNKNNKTDTVTYTAKDNAGNQKSCKVKISKVTRYKKYTYNCTKGNWPSTPSSTTIEQTSCTGVTQATANSNNSQSYSECDGPYASDTVCGDGTMDAGGHCYIKKIYNRTGCSTFSSSASGDPQTGLTECSDSTNSYHKYVCESYDTYVGS